VLAMYQVGFSFLQIPKFRKTYQKFSENPIKLLGFCNYVGHVHDFSNPKTYFQGTIISKI